MRLDVNVVAGFLAGAADLGGERVIAIGCDALTRCRKSKSKMSRQNQRREGK